jgi:hypothetical protein
MVSTTVKTPSYSSAPPPAVPAAAAPAVHRISKGLAVLERAAYRSPLEAGFIGRWREVLDDIRTYHDCVIAHSGYTATCSRGCTSCCCHWVEDVNSFEAEIMADFLRKHFPERIDAIIRCCRGDSAELERLDMLVQDRLGKCSQPGSEPPIDQVDLLLSVFYQLRRPCPLLLEDGSCLAYEVRPLTCRMYISFSDPLRCDPEYINTSLISTCIIDLSRGANRILDALHFKYLRFEGDTGLRSLLAKYLA